MSSRGRCQKIMGAQRQDRQRASGEARSKARQVRKAIEFLIAACALGVGGCGSGHSTEARIVVAGKASDTVPVGKLGSIGRASGLEKLR